jgi:hypothetical protein
MWLELVQHPVAVQTTCQRHLVRRLDVFGSAAVCRADPRSSDFDVVVEFEPQELLEWIDVYFPLVGGLESPLGPRVDLPEAHTPRNPCVIASMNRQGRGVNAA